MSFDRQLERTYLVQIEVQGRYALAATVRINLLLSTGRVESEDMFRELQAFVSCAASLSRLLWPPAIKDAQKNIRARLRGDGLRAALGVIEPHVLQDRSLRNHLEHFDERLDDWAETSRDHNIVDLMIGPKGAIAGDAIEDTDIFRQYDPTTKRFIFRGEEFDLQAIVYGVEQILRQVEVRRSQPPGPSP